MNKIFRVPMKAWVVGLLLIFAIMVMAATVWSFRSGIFWTGVCIVAVGFPFIGLYWWMLYVNPSKTKIEIRENGELRVTAPPFLTAKMDLGTVESARVVPNMDKDPILGSLSRERSMDYLGFKSGMFSTNSGTSVLLVSRSTKVLELRTDKLTYAFGPKEFDEFLAAVREHVVVTE